MAALLGWSKDSSSSLFERIQQDNSRIRSVPNVNSILHSIKHNLSNILNSHPGASQSAIEIGIIDLNDATIDTGDIYQRVQDAIEECILTYEPRIVQAKAKPNRNIDDPFSLHFSIEALILLDGKHEGIAFNLFLDNDHHYYIDLNEI